MAKTQDMRASLAAAEAKTADVWARLATAEQALGSYRESMSMLMLETGDPLAVSAELKAKQNEVLVLRAELTTLREYADLLRTATHSEAVKVWQGKAEHAMGSWEKARPGALAALENLKREIAKLRAAHAELDGAPAIAIAATNTAGANRAMSSSLSNASHALDLLVISLQPPIGDAVYGKSPQP